ncbi:MAG: class I SAM-dependent methyltransferase [Desulfamplus sp.]|nr:class I SAM-dependent methyltransferase [Desulfamplus sp.]
MPSDEWLKKEFHYGYSSGDIIAKDVVDKLRNNEESKIGGSYHQVASYLSSFINANSKVLELGPGRGSWSKVILNKLSVKGVLHTIDFQDVSQWLDPKRKDNRIVCHKVDSFNYSFLPDDYFDLFWSFGVLCHNNIDNIYTIFNQAYSKLKKQAVLIHQYSDWNKLENYGWDKGSIPIKFKHMRDIDIWWTRNNSICMQTILEACGYEIKEIDTGLLQRDGMFLAYKR